MLPMTLLYGHNHSYFNTYFLISVFLSDKQKKSDPFFHQARIVRLYDPPIFFLPDSKKLPKIFYGILSRFLYIFLRSPTAFILVLPFIVMLNEYALILDK